jgi:mannitol/fructose-specific phosphotransferase system IIA component (Ntr-type)
MSTGLGDILSERNILLSMRSHNRWEAIDELIDNLAQSGQLKPEDRAPITALVKKRETALSTGIGLGIAIPHGRTNLVSGILGALGRASQGIEFESLDSRPVHLAVLLVIPEGQLQEHLHTVANTTRLLRRPEVRQALEQATDAANMLQIIRDQEVG